MLDSMVSQGLIDSAAFSLDLRDTDSPDGALIFGGIDTGKFIGVLEKCPIIPGENTPSGADRYWINMVYIGMTDAKGNSGLLASGKLSVFLDSGGTLTRLPTEVFQTIGDAFSGLGAKYDSTSGFYIIDCSVMKEEGSIDFGFGEKVISVAFDNFIWQVPDSDTCVLGVLADDGKSRWGFRGPPTHGQLRVAQDEALDHILTERRRARSGRLFSPRGLRGVRPDQRQPPPRAGGQLRHEHSGDLVGLQGGPFQHGRLQGRHGHHGQRDPELRQRGADGHDEHRRHVGRGSRPRGDGQGHVVRDLLPDMFPDQGDPYGRRRGEEHEGRGGREGEESVRGCCGGGCAGGLACVVPSLSVAAGGFVLMPYMPITQRGFLVISKFIAMEY